MLFNTSFKFLGDCAAGTAVKNTTTNIDYMMSDDLMLYGAEIVAPGSTIGDYVAFQVIDKDNVLGAGADYVVNQWVAKWYVPVGLPSWKATSDMAGTIPHGLYLRLKYTNASLVADTDVKVNFFLISPI